MNDDETGSNDDLSEVPRAASVKLDNIVVQLYDMAIGHGMGGSANENNRCEDHVMVEDHDACDVSDNDEFPNAVYAQDIAVASTGDSESEDEIEEEVAKDGIRFASALPAEENTTNNYFCRGEGMSDVISSIDRPIDMFMYFINETLLARICYATNKYGREKYLNKWIMLTTTRLKQYIGITLLVGTLGIRNIHYAFGNKQHRGVCVPAVEECMSFNQFQQISSSLHFVDNELLGEDDAPLRKIAWFIEDIKRSFQAAYIPKRILSLDEMTTPYKGHWRLKQFIANKPHKWCIKMFALVEYDTWYVCNFEIYTGASHVYQELPYKNVFGNNPLAMHKACVDLIKPYSGKGRVVVSDRFYTSIGMYGVAMYDRSIMRSCHRRSIGPRFEDKICNRVYWHG